MFLCYKLYALGDGFIARGFGGREVGTQSFPAISLWSSHKAWIEVTFLLNIKRFSLVSMTNLTKVLKCANNDDTCMIRYNDAEGDCVKFTFIDEKKGRSQVSEKFLVCIFFIYRMLRQS